MNTGHEYSGVRLNTAECVSAQMRGSVSASGFSERGGQLVEAAPTRVSWTCRGRASRGWATARGGEDVAVGRGCHGAGLLPPVHIAPCVTERLCRAGQAATTAPSALSSSSEPRLQVKPQSSSIWRVRRRGRRATEKGAPRARAAVMLAAHVSP